ncbi:MAG: HlyD family type I secretion periplasmic adaptor subunit [Pseudomonadota bacterium]|jgi:hemolysin D|nr:HlyD family type I secretion periplasmic adaptor subunit [Rhodocyclaceae bacterium]
MKPAVMPLSADALDFAPGLLSLQESPPAKLPRTVLYCVVALFAVLLAWASFGKLDIVASAEGRLVPQTYVKIVQPAEAGIVQDILVREGQSVEAGQILMRMDAKLTEADARTLRNEYELKRLQLRRIDAELAGLPMHAEASDAPEIYAQVASQYAAHRQAYLDAVAQEQATLAKTRHDLQAAEELARKLRETVPTYRKSAAAFEKLGREGFLSPLAVEEKQRDRIEKEQDLRAQEATVASLKATLAASEKKLAQITSNYRAELQNERVETESQFRKLRDELEKIEYKAALLSLRAPQRGVIKDLATHTVGTVVSPGSVLMTLVPHGEPLQAEVYVKNEDVGFVHRDQRVKLKLSAYPFQKYGMIDGTVIHVGPDAADQPISSSKAGGDAPDAAVGLRYKALVRLDAQHLETDGNRLRLSSGMQVIAEIHQGQRTVMEYLLSPVQKAWQEAGRER